MAKVSFGKVKEKKEISTIKLGDIEVEVLKYLPMIDKLAIIEMSVQASLHDKFIHPVLIEQFFNLYVIYKYTNISFTDKQKEDESKIYDILESNGYITDIVNEIGSDYEDLLKLQENYVKQFEKYSTTLYGIISNIFDSVPQTVSEAMGMLDELDMSKLENLMNVVKQTAGGEDQAAEILLGQ